MALMQIDFYSNTLIRPVSFKMFIPNDPRADQPGPVEFPPQAEMKTLFLLHGYTGASEWWGQEKLAAQYNVALVMPNGENSFYLDGISTGHKYGTFLGVELVDYIRSTFGLATSAENTYICGLSMGGFGALHTALAYPDRFGKAGAMSSALIVHQIAHMKPKRNPSDEDEDPVANYEYYRECFGDLETVEESDANPEKLVEKLLAAGRKLPEIYMCCGTEDFLLEQNRSFHKFLTDSGVAHIYLESPGIHDDVFWDEYTPKIMKWMFEN